MTKKIFAVFAGAALLATGLAFAQMGAGRGAGHHPGWRMARYLQLTPEQRTELKTIHQEAYTASKPYADQLKAACTEIETMVKSGATPDAVAARAEALSASNQAAIQKLAGIHASAAAKAYAVLTPEQRQKAATIREYFGRPICGMGRFGVGMGPGPGAATAPAPAPAQ